MPWKLLQYGDYFEKVEKMLISLLKTRDYMIINIQAVKMESHKQSIQIV